MAKKIRVTETALRDAHQSLIATRMTTEEMLPVLDKLDKIGYYSLECWGGATYDSCLRFLNEDPWDRLRTIREHCPNTKLQMLFRGQNMLGYRHYADDCVEYLVQRSIANGIDIIRILMLLTTSRILKQLSRPLTKKAVMHRLLSATQQVLYSQMNTMLSMLRELQTQVQIQSVSRIWLLFLLRQEPKAL